MNVEKKSVFDTVLSRQIVAASCVIFVLNNLMLLRCKRQLRSNLVIMFNQLL